MRDRLFVLLQHLLPRHLLTAIVWRIARIRIPVVKNALISGFTKVFDVDLDEVRLEVPGGFETFNDFFVRELRDGARAIEGGADVIVSPVDGTVSAAGAIDGTTIFQAKGVGYSLADLLATDLDEVEHYVDGRLHTRNVYGRRGDEVVRSEHDLNADGQLDVTFVPVSQGGVVDPDDVDAARFEDLMQAAPQPTRLLGFYSRHGLELASPS